MKVLASLFAILSLLTPESTPASIQTTNYDYDDSSPSYCTPTPNPNLPQYILAYGSLMSTPSKDRTSPGTSETLPVLVRGYKRIWNCKGVSSSISTTYLGALPARTHLVGAAYRVPSLEALGEYDTRESFYCREEVPMSKIHLLTKDRGDLGVGQYWIYVTKGVFTDKPSRAYPIVQSYVDTWISGCMELEEKFKVGNFSRDCIRTTEGWGDGPWINDRIFPRRPFLYQPLAEKIDGLLREEVPKEFGGIEIEK